jgi:ribosomal protein L29
MLFTQSNIREMSTEDIYAKMMELNQKTMMAPPHLRKQIAQYIYMLQTEYQSRQ